MLLGDYKDRDTMYHLYIERGMNQHEIAKHLGIAQSTVRTWLINHGIRTRNQEDDINTIYRNRDWLEEHYIEKDMTAEEIGDMCGVHKKIILEHAKKYGLRKYSDRNYDNKMY